MTERVKAGIEKAQSDLRREHQRQLAEEGVLRQVPFLDSIMNWWSPIGEEAKPRGRALLLDSGEFRTFCCRQLIVARSQLCASVFCF